jgi:predicted AAA+ superfamily ATPase
VQRSTERRRQRWLRQYSEALLSRDVRDIANLEKLELLPRLLQALALMAGQLTNLNQLAGQHSCSAGAIRINARWTW